MSGNLFRKRRRRTLKRTGKTTSRLIVVSLILALLPSIAFTDVASTAPAPTVLQTSATDYPLAGWQTATPQEVGMDPTLFADAMNQMPSPSLVIRNGKIVGQKGDITRPGLIWSASKSLTALIFARLLQQGKISSYDVAVPNSNVPTNPTATYRQFMSMTSDYNLSPHSPGNHHSYNNGAVHFYGQKMKVTYYPNRNEVQMLQDAYVSALGFQDRLSYNGYLSGWDGGWSMSTRDMARIAYLVLHNGNWNGQQIVPASFINDLHKNQIPAGSTPAAPTVDEFYNQPAATAALPGAYSFGFWLPQGIQTEAITMSGAYGTSVHISRSKDLIVLGVNTSPNDHGGGKIPGKVLDMFAASITGATPTPTPTPTPTATPIRADLVTAPAGAFLQNVNNGTTINLAALSTSSISIKFVPATPIGSLRVQHNGVDRMDNVAPYSLAGDTNGSFNPANLPVGTHTITVTPYPQANLGGTPGTQTTISFAVVYTATATPPVVITEENSDNAIAFNAVTFTRGPFPLFTEQDFNSDKRTRLMLFAINVQPSAGAVVHAENSMLGSVSLPVEYIGTVPNFNWVTQIKVSLPDSLANAGDVWLRLESGGVSSNQARINIR